MEEKFETSDKLFQSFYPNWTGTQNANQPQI